MPALKKKRVNRVFIAVITIFAFIIGLFSYLHISNLSEAEIPEDLSVHNDVSSEGISDEDVVEEDEPMVLEWSELIPEIKRELDSIFPKREFRLGDIGIYRQGDVSGNGTDEALVKVACGATTCELVPFKLDGEEPVSIKFKQKAGFVSPIIFTSGGGGAGRYGNGTELEIDKNAISFNYFFIYGGDEDKCESEVYRLNHSTGVFEYSSSLSHEKRIKYCEGHPCETATMIDSKALKDICEDL